MKIISIFYFVLTVCCLLLIGVSLFINSLVVLNEKDSIIEVQAAKVTELQEQVFWLRRINSKTEVLEQLLTPQMIDELGTVNEVIKQKRFSKLP